MSKHEYRTKHLRDVRRSSTEWGRTSIADSSVVPPCVRMYSTVCNKIPFKKYHTKKNIYIFRRSSYDDAYIQCIAINLQYAYTTKKNESYFWPILYIYIYSQILYNAGIYNTLPAAFYKKILRKKPSRQIYSKSNYARDITAPNNIGLCIITKAVNMSNGLRKYKNMQVLLGSKMSFPFRVSWIIFLRNCITYH